jgi:4-methyl-5(b-hydroxyethyl)-thiazole monophosphate biosynthesis
MGSDPLNRDTLLYPALFLGSAAPTELARAGLLDSKRAIGFPGTLEKLTAPNITIENNPVVQDGKVITSRGPGTAMDFALELIELLSGKEKRDAVETDLQRPHQ